MKRNKYIKNRPFQVDDKILDHKLKNEEKNPMQIQTDFALRTEFKREISISSISVQGCWSADKYSNKKIIIICKFNEQHKDFNS